MPISSNIKKVLTILVISGIGVLTLGIGLVAIPQSQFALAKIENYFTEEPVLPSPLKALEVANQPCEEVAPVVSKAPALKDIAFDILASTVRITLESGSSGSGVILWSELSSVTQTFHTFIITNSHVVREEMRVEVESFSYLDRKSIAGITSYAATVVCQNIELDLALLEIRSSEKIGKAAHFVTNEDLESLSLYDSILVCGSGLGQPPYITKGNLAIYNEEEHHLITTFSIFGNSGGGAFVESGKLFAIVAGIRAVPLQGGITVPEPNLTDCVSSQVVTNWLLRSPFGFVLGQDLSLADDYFLKQKKARGKFR